MVSRDLQVIRGDAELVTDEIRVEAARLLEELRQQHGHQPRAPYSLGTLFDDTPGLPVPLDEWIAETDPDAGWGPPTR